ncbi:MAG: (d)CMP kinase [Erysipelotrichaceae bacterium]
MKINIAIDGPSAAGKSTVAKELAKRLGYTHLDTGSMYRAVAYITKEANIKIDDEEKIVNLINMSNIEISNDNHITVNGKDITEIIRSNEISMAASDVSKLKRVREALVAMQRKIASQKGYILDGRDIGTVVLNDAEVKIYLIASAETRAQRRVLQNKEKGIPYDYEQILEDIKKRDYQDIHRKESPLKKAEDAIEIDSSDMTQEEVILEILDIINKRI